MLKLLDKITSISESPAHLTQRKSKDTGMGFDDETDEKEL
jgi:hypothetical protein